MSHAHNRAHIARGGTERLKSHFPFLAAPELPVLGSRPSPNRDDPGTCARGFHLDESFNCEAGGLEQITSERYGRITCRPRDTNRLLKKPCIVLRFGQSVWLLGAVYQSEWFCRACNSHEEGTQRAQCRDDDTESNFHYVCLLPNGASATSEKDATKSKRNNVFHETHEISRTPIGPSVQFIAYAAALAGTTPTISAIFVHCEKRGLLIGEFTLLRERFGTPFESGLSRRPH